MSVSLKHRHLSIATSAEENPVKCISVYLLRLNRLDISLQVDILKYIALSSQTTLVK